MLIILCNFQYKSSYQNVPNEIMGEQKTLHDYCLNKRPMGPIAHLALYVSSKDIVSYGPLVHED